MARDPHALKIHIDGSALENSGGQGGIAAIVEYPDGDCRESAVIFKRGFSESTNNRMELLACIGALKWARGHFSETRPPRVVILTDSAYVADAHKQAALWKNLKLRTRDGRPVDNSDLWDEFLTAKSKVGVRADIEWEKGKRTIIAKEVHTQASHAAQTSPDAVDPGFRAGKLSPSKFPGIAASMFPANGEQITIRIYRKDFLYRNKQKECKVFFEVYSDGAYVTKHFCYCSPEIEQELHRQYHYTVQFNDNRKYPMIEAIIDEIRIQDMF